MLNKVGQQITTIGSQGYVGIDLDSDDNMIALNSNMGKRVIQKIDASTDKIIWTIDLSTQSARGINMMNLNRIIYSKADDSIYYLTI